MCRRRRHCRSKGPSRNKLCIRCAQIGLGRGAREGVYPQRYSTDGATKPQANFSATRRAACLLGGGVVARSSQIHFGICSSLAPSLRPKSIAANVYLFRRHHTRVGCFGFRSAAARKSRCAPTLIWRNILFASTLLPPYFTVTNGYSIQLGRRQCPRKQSEEPFGGHLRTRRRSKKNCRGRGRAGHADGHQCYFE